MTQATYRNPAGLTADNISMLDKVTQKVRDQDKEVADELMRYIIDGDDEQVLGKLVGLAADLRLLCANGHVPGVLSWPTFFRDLESEDLALYQRLARVFEAAARNVPARMLHCQDYFDNNRWLEVLLQEATKMGSAAQRDGKKRPSVSLILQMLAADGRDGDVFLTAPFRGKDKDYLAYNMRNMVRSVKGIGAVYAQRHDLIAPYLLNGSAEQRVFALENLQITDTPLAPFVVELVTCATGTAKTIREAASALLRSVAELAQPHLERLALEGSRGEREHAVRLLGRLRGNAAHEFLRALRETEKSAPVLETIDAMLGDVTVAGTPEPLVLEVPPNAPLDTNPQTTPALREALLGLADMYRARAEQHAQQLANRQAKQYVHPNHPLPALPEDWLNKVCALLEGRETLHPYLLKTFSQAGILWGEPKGAYLDLLAHPDFKLLFFVRWLALMGSLKKKEALEYQALATIDTYRNAHAPPFSLNELAEAIRAIGFSDECLFQVAMNAYWQPFDWEADAVWPYFYENLPLLEKCFQPTAHRDYSLRWQAEAARNAAFRILKQFPAVPPAIVGIAWDLAVGTSKQDRQRAQPICDKLPDVQERLAVALTSGNFQTRQVAAEWLGRLGNVVAVPSLVAAARKEKQDAALDAMLTALEKLGQSISEFLDRDKLQADAVKNLKKGTPPALAWFPWSGLPKVRWHDSGKPVPVETVSWLIVQSHKLKTAEPGALLKRYCELMKSADREELGNFVLNAWLSQDLKRKLTDEEARAQAKQQAPQHWQSMQYMIGYYQKQNQPVPASVAQSLQACEEQLFAQAQREVGSAAGDKGVLALAGACCGDAAVGPVQRYLKEWYGYRAAQCKALIAMLSGVDRPLAIQYILSISNRFRTKSIQEEADKYIHLLAERKGWTLDELADRTMPTCGLDDDGKLDLSFGPRTFTARVNAELEIQLYDADGKALKKLPDPRKEDDEELAKAAKKAFSAAKTELKKFFGLSRTRLYEAMCTERTWPLADWQLYLLSHPLAKFLCQRLVWVVLQDGAVLQTFRPLDDGTLSDSSDNSVTPPEGSLIRIAHACNVSAETCQAWTQHLADYEVAPLISQFARGPYELPEGRRRETGIKDFEGYMLEAFKLRGLATKFGYTRAAAEDGGWFHEYLKSFPGLGIEVHLGFSGNGLPEENRTVALTTMTFERKSESGESGASRRGVNIPLKDLPAVLLAECVGDLRALAAAGSGFVEDWEKKVY
jgi:hypothetical protein